MKKDVKGAVTAVISIIVYIVVSFVLSYLYGTFFTDDIWNGLGLFFVLMFIGAALIVLVILVSIYIYLKQKNEFYLGILYGVVGLFMFFVFQTLLETVFGW